MRNQLLAATALSTSVLFLVPGVTLAQTGVVDWSGFYIGGSAGISGGATLLSFDYDSAFDSPSSLAVPILGLTGTVTAGFNVQQGDFVYGIAADGTFQALRGELQSPDDDPFYEAEGQLDSLLALRGRLGLASGPLLYYATAGVAAGHARFSANVVDGSPTGASAPSGAEGIVFGPTVGAGIEYALNDTISLTTEGIVTDVGPLTATGDNGKGGYDVTARTRTLNLRSGINVHF
jgi:outer membrane immunogenic protein